MYIYMENSKINFNMLLRFIVEDDYLFNIKLDFLFNMDLIFILWNIFLGIKF